MVAKVANIMQGWQGRFLSHGGKVVLIKSVLQSIPLHLLSVVHPPKTVLSQIDKITSTFSRGRKPIGIKDTGKLGVIYAIQSKREEQVSGLYMISAMISL